MITKTAGIMMVMLLAIIIGPTQVFAEKSVVDEIVSNFKGVDFIHKADGTAKVITYDDWSQVLKFGSDFSSTPGPDLYVYLSTDDRASDFVNLGKLDSSNGAQEYAIPAGTDLNKYSKVLIWCKAFGVLFGTAQLPEYTASPDTSEEDESMEKKMEEKTMQMIIEKESLKMEKEKAVMQTQKENTSKQTITRDRVLIKGDLTSPENDKPFGGDTMGEVYVRILDGEKVRVFATVENSTPKSTVLEGWLIDLDSDYKLSLGKTNSQNKLVFTERMVNPWIYDVLVITEEPIEDTDPAPNKPVGGSLLSEPFGTA